MESERQERSVEVMYGSEDLGASALFPDGWINFGYWKGLNPSTRVIRERVEASKNLYRLIHDELSLSTEDRVVEVGSGRGHGIGLLVSERKVHDAVGIDITPEQIERANRIYAGLVASYLANFFVGAAERLPVREASADKMYSVEAIQHFRNVESFSKEAFRVLKGSGVLVVTSFFLTAPEFADKVRELIPTVNDGIDRVVPIETTVEHLRAAGFRDVTFRSIGGHVWEGWNSWVAFIHGSETWGRSWKRCADAGWLDYYLIRAAK